uniref:Aladin seven-bladed propeller domain-containing protein n=1 Tax=Arion vulgaris TaxID=1028688 RepID=A0A0B7A6Y9_9EUPU
MASILLQFPPPPRRSFMTVFEQEGQLKDVPESYPISCLPDYPDVTIQSERSCRMNVHYESAQNAFLAHEQTSWKRSLHAWYNGGFVNMLEELTNASDEVPVWLSAPCSKLLSFVQRLKSLTVSLFPQKSMSYEELLSKYSHVSNWHKSPVQALAWHPHVTKLAVALKDDSVVVYSSGSTLCPILKHKLQKQVADLAWQPLSSSVLAVGCQTCILIWHVEPMSLAIRPSSSTVQILHSNSHSPITSLAWSPDSDLLLSASPKHSSIMVWDVPKEVGVALRRDRGGGVSLLSYSPDGSKLFTSTLSSLFRVWETKNWHSEIWSNLTGQCVAACWSPDGTVLIFAMEGDSSLYGVRFRHGDNGSLSALSTSIMIADVSQVSVSTELIEQVRVGGQVKSIVWDTTGERIAVLFEPNELGNNSLVAVFKVTIHPILELLPGGFVKGRSGESAHHIAFQPSFQKGALLSVVWSSGRVGYVPMYFVPAQEIQQQRRLQLGPWSTSSTMTPKDRF